MRNLTSSLTIIALLVSSALIVGCGNTEAPEAEDAKRLASTDASTPAPTVNDKPSPQQAVDPTDGAAAPPASEEDKLAGTLPIAGREDDPVDPISTRPQALPDGLPPEKLVEFLAIADKDLRAIANHQTNIRSSREARSEMKRITKLKLDAARKLVAHEEADEDAKIEGARGELQALSTLASMGDVKSADTLAIIARRNLGSNDDRLVADSRLVLIGFAIESLQNGKDEGADEVVELINDLASAESEPDLPAMMVMGQARQVLTQAGHDDKAKQVRDKIIDLFANSPDPNIAKMAAQMAGNVRFDAITKLRSLAVAGEEVAVARWREAATSLIDESADMLTIHYLAGTALQLEAAENEELANATYDIMSEKFTEEDAATTREVKAAIAARAARKAVIGEEFDLDLPSTSGDVLSMTDYRGKVVLVPFWSSGFPESLQIVPLLHRLRNDHPDQVAIVGMNLDPAGAKVDAYAEKELGFPSYRSESTATATMGNPVAARFGAVSMPFVAIINQKGIIEAVDFSGRKIDSTVEKLLAP